MDYVEETYFLASEDARKLLGQNAKFPDPPAGMSKAVQAALDNEKDFSKSSDLVDDTTQEFVNLIVKIKSEIRRYNAAVQKADFGLDMKNSDKQKKVLKVRKYFQSNFDSLNEHWDAALDKIEAQLDAIKADAKKRKEN